jgi:hypothetical protein
MDKIMKKRSIAALVAAPVMLLAAGGSALAATSSDTAAPSNLYGCVSGASRTVEGAYTDAGNFKTCPKDSFPFTVASGVDGKNGTDGASGFSGAFYATATYTNGGDGWATVLCIPAGKDGGDLGAALPFTAIAGGVEEDDAPGNTGPAGSSVIASFPGNLDFSGGSDNNSPLPGVVDGWVIGLGNPGATNMPLKVWALCVPNADFGSSKRVPIVNNDYS